MERGRLSHLPSRLEYHLDCQVMRRRVVVGETRYVVSFILIQVCDLSSRTLLTALGKTGAMVAMTPSMILRGTVSFSWMKLLTRSDFAKSEYVGTRVPTPQKPDDFDQVVLAPNSLGDVASVTVDTDKPGAREWKVGRDAFLAATSGVKNDYTAQKLTQAVFSGEGFFVYTFRGYGFLWIQSFGGIVEHKVCVPPACQPTSRFRN